MLEIIELPIGTFKTLLAKAQQAKKIINKMTMTCLLLLKNVFFKEAITGQFSKKTIVPMAHSNFFMFLVS